MQRTLVYDLPIRIFHWLFAGLFLFSFIVGKTVDDESQLFIYHMLSGLLMGALLVWRVVWGLWGAKHSRFSSFSLNPLDLKDYFLGIVSGAKKKWAGHNPASSWAALAMFAMAIGMVVTGILMTTGSKEAFEDVHEIFANAFVLIVIMHVAGVILHTIRHKDLIGLSMIDGKKQVEDKDQGIRGINPAAALVLVLFVGSTAFFLLKNFDSRTGTLNVLGTNLQLSEEGGEAEEESSMVKESGEENSADSDEEGDEG